MFCSNAPPPLTIRCLLASAQLRASFGYERGPTTCALQIHSSGRLTSFSDYSVTVCPGRVFDSAVTGQLVRFTASRKRPRTCVEKDRTWFCAHVLDVV